jgi:nucleotide-binding universal stress UspA family protein
LRNVLVPIDFSETSTKALPYVSELAKTLRAEVTLIHVMVPLPTAEFIYPTSAEIRPQIKRSAEDFLLRVQHESLNEAIPTETVVRSGFPYLEITKCAQRMQSDMIIMTSHGHTGFNRALLGSTADRVVRHSPCPVLVVRDKGNP